MGIGSVGRMLGQLDDGSVRQSQLQSYPTALPITEAGDWKASNRLQEEQHPQRHRSVKFWDLRFSRYMACLPIHFLSFHTTRYSWSFSVILICKQAALNRLLLPASKELILQCYSFDPEKPKQGANLAGWCLFSPVTYPSKQVGSSHPTGLSDSSEPGFGPTAFELELTSYSWSLENPSALETSLFVYVTATLLLTPAETWLRLGGTAERKIH